MLRISDLVYSIDGRRLFDGASATIPTGHKVGLIGPNGAGKTTLFKLIHGELALESGSFEVPRLAKIGGVAQEAPASPVSILDTVLAADVERAELLADTSQDPNRIAEIQTRLADIDAWSAESRAASILKGLGFDSVDQQRPCSDFSGGWRMRIALAGVLFAQPDFLLLDEPTNYLDLEGALWLEDFIVKYPHTCIIISHDRGLLNRAVGSILHLEDKRLTLYQGPYDTFARTRAAQDAVQAAAAKKQAAAAAHLQSFVDRFRAKASKAKQAQSRIKALEKMEPITPPGRRASQKFTFPEPTELSPPIFAVEDVTVGYNGKPVLSQLDFRIDPDDRIALLGKNGEGKSTLAKLISNRLGTMNGSVSKSSKLKIGYFAQHQVDELVIGETPLEHLQVHFPGETPSKLRARLAGFGLGSEQAENIVGSLSGGQKARLSLLLATLDAPHLLILDEPTNHLDIESREGLIEALAAYKGAVILVSHDMHLLSLVADELWLVSGGTVKRYDGDLDSYRDFLLAKPVRKPKEKKPEKKQKPTRDMVLDARAAVRTAEVRMEKLMAMHEKLQEKLADPSLYNDEYNQDRIVWQKKYHELEAALPRAEKLWMDAAETLEKLEAKK